MEETGSGLREEREKERKRRNVGLVALSAGEAKRHGICRAPRHYVTRESLCISQPRGGVCCDRRYVTAGRHKYLRYLVDISRAMSTDTLDAEFISQSRVLHRYKKYNENTNISRLW